MSQENRRFMRLIVYFDLPMTTPQGKKAYNLFRRFLLKDGYDMLQFSVYCRLVNGVDHAEKHLRRLAANVPPEGSVRCMQVSEKQFAATKILVGPRGKAENPQYADQLRLF